MGLLPVAWPIAIQQHPRVLVASTGERRQRADPPVHGGGRLELLERLLPLTICQRRPSSTNSCSPRSSPRWMTSALRVIRSLRVSGSHVAKHLAYSTRAGARRRPALPLDSSALRPITELPVAVRPGIFPICDDLGMRAPARPSGLLPDLFQLIGWLVLLSRGQSSKNVKILVCGTRSRCSGATSPAAAVKTITEIFEHKELKMGSDLLNS